MLSGNTYVLRSLDFSNHSHCLYVLSQGTGTLVHSGVRWYLVFGTMMTSIPNDGCSSNNLPSLPAAAMPNMVAKPLRIEVSSTQYRVPRYRHESTDISVPDPLKRLGTAHF